MPRNKLFYLMWMVCLLIAACVSKDQYEELEATLSETRAQLEQKANEIKKLEDTLSDIRTQLEEKNNHIKGIQTALPETRSLLDEKNKQIINRCLFFTSTFWNLRCKYSTSSGSIFY